LLSNPWEEKNETKKEYQGRKYKTALFEVRIFGTGCTPITRKARKNYNLGAGGKIWKQKDLNERKKGQ